MFSLKHLRLREQRRQPLQKFSQKAPQSPALPPRKLPALRAEVIGQSVGSDASPLSCFLFRPRKRLEKRRKRSHTNVSNALATRTSRPPAQTPQRSFQQASAGTHATPAPNRAHSGLHGETRGVLDGGGITTLGAFCAVRKPCAAGCQNGKLCRFWALVERNLEERREPAEQRRAHARRCSEASRPRWAA